MHNIWILARKEYNHYFISPIAYVFMIVIYVTLGLLFFVDILFASQYTQYIPSIQNLLQLLVFPLLFLGIPALTMRSLSEENKSGTLELLLTSPITDFQLILGKWLGAFLFLCTIVVVTFIYPAILNSLVTPGIDLKVLASGYLGLILFISAATAMGVAISSFTSNQIVSLFASVGSLIIFWIISAPAQVMQGAVGEVLKYLCIPTHFYSTFLTGIIRLDDITYFISFTIIALLIGAARVESRRWG